MSGKNGKKLGEPEARILVLRIAAENTDRRASTSEIKSKIPKYRELTDADLKKSITRPNEHKWEQIVGNATGSHKKSSTSIFNRGLAIRTEDGIHVTEAGIAHLKKLVYQL